MFACVDGPARVATPCVTGAGMASVYPPFLPSFSGHPWIQRPGGHPSSCVHQCWHTRCGLYRPLSRDRCMTFRSAVTTRVRQRNGTMSSGCTFSTSEMVFCTSSCMRWWTSRACFAKGQRVVYRGSTAESTFLFAVRFQVPRFFRDSEILFWSSSAATWLSRACTDVSSSSCFQHWMTELHTRMRSVQSSTERSKVAEAGRE
jgi:hypothetical protein